MDKFRVNEGSKLLYEFIWHDFCDWYIELIKDRLYSDDEEVKRITLERALGVFEAALRMLHPFMPFVTEEIWHKMEPGRNGRSIMDALLPELRPELIDEAAMSRMSFLQQLVEGVRTIQGEMNVPAGKSCDVVISAQSEEQVRAILDNTHFLERLARIARVDAAVGLTRPPLSASTVVGGADVYVPLEGLIDIDVERQRLGKEIVRVEGLLKGIESKLGNENFLAKAPEEVVVREKDKQENFRLTLDKLQANLRSLEQH
jgi:valyl-tRNA synthetase